MDQTNVDQSGEEEEEEMREFNVNYNDGIIQPLLQNLISKCTHGDGIGSMNQRKRIWPIINNVRHAETLHFKNFDIDEFTKNKNHNIVYLDCTRYNHYLTNELQVENNEDCDDDEGIVFDDVTFFSDKLYTLIMKVMCRNEHLSYYQVYFKINLTLKGYHDVASVLMLVLGQDLGANVLLKLSNLQLRDFLRPNLNATIKILNLVHTVVEIYDWDLYCYIKRSQVGTIFCLPWIITWFSHSVRSLSQACRIFDFLMVSHNLMSIYLSAAILMAFRDQIFSVECEVAPMHKFLSQIPQQMTRNDWKECILASMTIFNTYDPQYIMTYNRDLFSHRFYLTLSKNFTRKRHPPGLNKKLLRNSFNRNGSTPGSGNVTRSISTSRFILVSATVTIAISLALIPTFKWIFS